MKTTRLSWMAAVLAVVGAAVFITGCGGADGEVENDGGDASDVGRDGDAEGDLDGVPDLDAATDPDAVQDIENDGERPPSCGNDITEPGEVCDGSDVNPSSCSALPGFRQGTVTCRSDCLGYDVSGCEAGGSVEALGCSQEDVQAAIDAASDGDTVLVPEGDCTWTTLEAGRPAVVIENKTVVIQGAGAGRTIIRDDTGLVWGEWGFDIQESADHGFRITGFTFSGRTGSINADDYFLLIRGSSKTWRIDNCTFTDWTDGEILEVRMSASYGVIDSCNFDYDFVGQPIQVAGENDDDWERPLSLGTRDAVFIEGCIFNNTGETEGILDSDSGARVVVRYNTINNGAYHNHGRDSGARDVTRSALSYEVYENTLTSTSVRWCAMDSRGGTGVIFNNTTTGQYDAFMLLYNYCSCWGYSGSCPSWPQCMEYPCTDQIGRAPDADGDGIQDLEPLYEWGNTVDISGSGEPHLQVPGVMCDEMLAHVQEGRDYFNNTPRPGYVPFPYPHPLRLIAP